LIVTPQQNMGTILLLSLTLACRMQKPDIIRRYW